MNEAPASGLAGDGCVLVGSFETGAHFLHPNLAEKLHGAARAFLTERRLECARVHPGCHTDVPQGQGQMSVGANVLLARHSLATTRVCSTAKAAREIGNCDSGEGGSDPGDRVRFSVLGVECGTEEASPGGASRALRAAAPLTVKQSQAKVCRAGGGWGFGANQPSMGRYDASENQEASDCKTDDGTKRNRRSIVGLCGAL